VKKTISDYDKRLDNVIEKHKFDFIKAYKNHMGKVEE
jgi:hypothetical protein